MFWDMSNVITVTIEVVIEIIYKEIGPATTVVESASGTITLM